VSDSGISKFATRSRQITTPAPHHSLFYRTGPFSATQPTASKHWRQFCLMQTIKNTSTLLDGLKSAVVCVTNCFSWMANPLMLDTLPSRTVSRWSLRGQSSPVDCWLSRNLPAVKTEKCSSAITSLFLAWRTSSSRQTTQFATPSMCAPMCVINRVLGPQQLYPTVSPYAPFLSYAFTRKPSPFHSDSVCSKQVATVILATDRIATAWHPCCVQLVASGDRKSRLCKGYVKHKPPQKCSFPWCIWTPSNPNAKFLQPTRVCPSNRLTIGSSLCYTII